MAMVVYSPEKKQAILDDAKVRILQGHPIKQIASSHKIDVVTLHTWLLGLGDEYQELLQLYIDNKLATADNDLQTIADPQSAGEVGISQFKLARARDRLKSAQWLAEHRDKRYQPKVEQQSVVITPVFQIVSRADIRRSDVMSNDIEQSLNTSEQADRMLASKPNTSEQADRMLASKPTGGGDVSGER